MKAAENAAERGARRIPQAKNHAFCRKKLQKQRKTVT